MYIHNYNFEDLFTFAHTLGPKNVEIYSCNSKGRFKKKWKAINYQTYLHINKF